MVRSEILQKMCNLHPNVLQKDMKKIFKTIFFELTEALCRGENIEIRGFGTYKVKKRRARIGRNPKNSETIQIPEKKTIRWKMSKILYNRINENFAENRISATN